MRRIISGIVLTLAAVTAVGAVRSTSQSVLNIVNHTTGTIIKPCEVQTFEACQTEVDTLGAAAGETKESGSNTYRIQWTKRFNYKRSTAPLPVNCAVSEWSAWSPCENGTQLRARTIVTQPANGGSSCPALTESLACEVVPETWTKCTDEWGTCQISAPSAVRYGAGEPWVEREISVPIVCETANFGGVDHHPNVLKRCEVRAGRGGQEPEPEPEPRPGTATLKWENRSAYTVISVFQSVSEWGPWSLVAAVRPDTQSYVVTNLTHGTYYWQVVGSIGSDSAASNVVSKTVR